MLTCRADLVATRPTTALGVTKALAPAAPRARAAMADFMVLRVLSVKRRLDAIRLGHRLMMVEERRAGCMKILPERLRKKGVGGGIRMNIHDTGGAGGGWISAQEQI